MSIQYISDNKGKPTGVYIPIEEWNKLKQKYEGLKDVEGVEDVPEWQQDEVSQRFEQLLSTPDISIDFNEMLNKLKVKHEL
ncbi:MAG: hypothetical protein KAG37_00140 [Flavobacteriales bacterium]|nr:hypothetical protein [Flavobacteriales bacterium]